MISKDESIITQVAAKIAADLATSVKPDNIELATADWAIAFEIVRDSLLSACSGAVTTTVTSQPTQYQPVFMPDMPTSQVQEVFPSAQYVPQQVQAPSNMTVTVKGTQHGPLPDWLIAQCAAAGVTSVWDNRDGLAQNPKRPWFKAADGTKNARGDDMAFWAPRGK